MSPPYDPLVERALAMVGQTLRDKWHLDALIGVGGMASVFAATHRNGRRGAVKLLHTELSFDRVVRNRFLREGYVANKVAHPGTVEVLDDDVADNGAVFLVMELLDGENAERRWTRNDRRLDPREVLAIADQVLDVLDVAHSREIVHRDIKPENIFIRRDGIVKLLDFGIARVKELSTATSATRFGTMLGTPAYMSPEQALGHNDEVGPVSDLWALGATMHTLLTGKHVHGGKTVNEQLVAAATAPAAPIRSVDSDVPEPVAEVIDKALAFAKQDRWSDAQSMRQAGQDAYRQLCGVSIAESPPLYVPDCEDQGAHEMARTHRMPTGAVGVVTTMKPGAVSTRPSRMPRFKRWHVPAVGVLSLALGGVVAMTARKVAAPPADGPTPMAAGPAQDPALKPEDPPLRPLSALSAPTFDLQVSSVSAVGPELPPDAAVANGKLYVSARGGRCPVIIDGSQRGTTPISGLIVPVGEHQLTCRGTDGAAHSQSVVVKASEAAHVLFILSSPPNPVAGRPRPTSPRPPADPGPSATVSEPPPPPPPEPSDPKDRRK
jgi:eukaryotic-like serine/threonine-protein kinase